MILSLDAMQAGECVYMKTQTAQYWLLLLGNLVASVYRQGEHEHHATLLEKRRLSNRASENEGFTMFDHDKQPVAAIIPIVIQRVPADTIPLRRS